MERQDIAKMPMLCYTFLTFCALARSCILLFAFRPSCVCTENMPDTEHWKEKEEWKEIKADPMHGHSQAKGLEGLV